MPSPEAWPCAGCEVPLVALPCEVLVCCEEPAVLPAAPFTGVVVEPEFWVAPVAVWEAAPWLFDPAAPGVEVV